MPFIILDRDGVINYDSDAYIKSPEEWRAIPGSLEAIAYLNRAGFRILVATNQSGIARGYYDIEMLDLIHEKMLRELAAVGGYIEEIFFCPHHPQEQCACRKPKPGLLQQIAEKYSLNLSETFFIGDSLVDVQAAQAVKCKPILLLTGKYPDLFVQHPSLEVIPHFTHLSAAAEYVLAQTMMKGYHS